MESGRADSRGGVSPWPWSINVGGTDQLFDSKAEAIAAVLGYQAQGVRSIDVGCLQVNLMYHPDAFASLDEAFDPVANANYAAKFLSLLFSQSGSWQRATALYHSATPDVGANYQQKVAAVLPEEQRIPAPALVPGSAPGSAPGLVGPMLAMAAGPGPILLDHRASAARILPAAPGTVGRGLDAYRAAPVPISGRLAPAAPM